MSARIERVTSERTFPLRQRVLRPHDTVDELALSPADDTSHFAAVEDGIVIATAVVVRESAPWAAEVAPAWRLRGMATAETRRREGLGASVLEAAIEHVRQNGGGLLWCNARVPAVSFYERGGFVTRGESWEDPTLGSHVAMERVVSSS